MLTQHLHNQRSVLFVLKGHAMLCFYRVAMFVVVQDVPHSFALVHCAETLSRPGPLYFLLDIVSKLLAPQNAGAPKTQV